MLICFHEDVDEELSPRPRALVNERHTLRRAWIDRAFVGSTGYRPLRLSSPRRRRCNTPTDLALDRFRWWTHYESMIIVCGGSVRSVWGGRSWRRELHEKRGLQEWSCVSESMCRGERDRTAKTSCASMCSLWGTIVPCLARHLPPRMTGSSSTCLRRVWTNHLPSHLSCLSSVSPFPSVLHFMS